MRGTCNEFCPPEESKLRIREKLLHYYEYKNGQKNVPGILVKSFARSAAGVKSPDPKNLRTLNCLKRTVEYLLTDIAHNKRRPYCVAYDFIFDRLRAVRQETIIQSFRAQQLIGILEPIIMFLAYSCYQLCEEPIQNFDPKICEQHLQECLKRILVAYDECGEDTADATNRRCYIEALYQVHNLGSQAALMRALQLSKTIRSIKVFADAYTIALDYNRGHFYRVITGMQHLPHIIAALCSLHMQKLRRNFYEIFSHAYSSKQLSVPVDFICKIVKETPTTVISDCLYYNLDLTIDKKAIQFSKSGFSANMPPQRSKHEVFVEEKLKQIHLPDVLLLRQLK